MNKKGFIPIAASISLTVGVIIALGILVFAIFASAAFFIWVMKMNIFWLIGPLILLGTGIIVWRFGFRKGLGIAFLVGVALTLLPFFITAFREITLNALFIGG